MFFLFLLSFSDEIANNNSWAQNRSGINTSRVRSRTQRFDDLITGQFMEWRGCGQHGRTQHGRAHCGGAWR
jgi:hypothetical protein